jgi:ubiquinone/menaquinone biosynthesis C-methylase UbiE
MQPMGLRFSDDALPVAYDRLFTASLFEPWARILIDLVGVRPGDAVLDVATGPGTVARMVAARAGTSGRVVGVDISEPMLEVARSKPAEPGAAPIEFIRRSADDLQLPDASFDVVLCQQGLQFFPDQIAALREMRRALNPRGRLGISVWAKGYGRDIEELLSECLTELGARQPTYPNFGTHADDLTAALSEVGFVPIRGEDRDARNPLERWCAGAARKLGRRTNARRAYGAGLRACAAVLRLRFPRGVVALQP